MTSYIEIGTLVLDDWEEDNHHDEVQIRRVLAFIALCVLLSGCGSSTDGGSESRKKATIMPAVMGARLDVAKSDLASAGIDSDGLEVVGGGTFGIVDESKWVVCEQEPAPGETAVGSTRLVVERECSTPPAAAAPAPVGTSAPAPAATPSAQASVMPNVMCMSLQEAQNEIQRHGVFFSGSIDATGQGRMQLVDSNWQVVAQTPPAGTPIGEGDANLSAVKYGEPSPC